MKILAINGTYQPRKTTTRLTEKALEGAASVGAETEMILLCKQYIEYCRNCLTCYKDLESDLGPCPIKDDMDMILEKIQEADGIILSSPVHNGFLTGIMTVFFERLTFRLCKATGHILNVRGCPEPRRQKVRAMAVIVSAGGMPPQVGRKYCNEGTPFIKDNLGMALNAASVGEMYAGALYPHKLSVSDWTRAFLLRELTDEQLEEAYRLGLKLGETLRDGKAKPYDPLGIFGPIAKAYEAVARLFHKDE